MNINKTEVFENNECIIIGAFLGITWSYWPRDVLNLHQLVSSVNTQLCIKLSVIDVQFALAKIFFGGWVTNTSSSIGAHIVANLSLTVTQKFYLILWSKEVEATAN